MGVSQAHQVGEGRAAGMDRLGPQQRAHLLQRGSVLGVAAAVDADRASGGGVQAHDHLHGRALFAPLGPRKPGDGTGLDHEVEPVHHRLLSASLRQLMPSIIETSQPPDPHPLAPAPTLRTRAAPPVVPGRCRGQRTSYRSTAWGSSPDPNDWPLRGSEPGLREFEPTAHWPAPGRRRRPGHIRPHAEGPQCPRDACRPTSCLARTSKAVVEFTTDLVTQAHAGA